MNYNTSIGEDHHINAMLGSEFLIPIAQVSPLQGLAHPQMILWIWD
ncbi:hypothetical protein KUH03_10140 [Sphingobacterium sp. E70]|nr:hypothetical protein [Sphingobacterium sp. E70]ULT27095.1 hypothetical protein KUH03_10140 [Sphingobacterium sp. E70]